MNFTKIDISNFRGIRHCVLGNLGMVNLFFGKNNCGKSSLLEAVFLLSGPSNPTLPVLINNLRSLNSFSEEDLRVNFHDLDVSSEIRIVSEGEQRRNVQIKMVESHSRQINLEQLNQNNTEKVGKHYGLRVQFSVGDENKVHHTELIVSDSNNARANTDKTYKEALYAEYIPSGSLSMNVRDKLEFVINNKMENTILEALRIIEPQIKDIQLVGNKVMVDVGLPTRLPINVLGDGARKILYIILSVLNAKNGVLLFDEIDNGLHYTTMRKLWDVILHTCKKMNTQLFVSTHSLDMVKSLVACIEGGKDAGTEVSSYKLVKKNDGELVALHYDAPHLVYAINQEMEVR